MPGPPGSQGNFIVWAMNESSQETDTDLREWKYPILGIAFQDTLLPLSMLSHGTVPVS